MAAQALDTISANLKALGLEDGASQSVEKTARPQLVDTPEAVKALVDTLFSVEADCASIYVDLEGIWIPLHQQAFVVDVYMLGTRAFDTLNSDGKTMRSVLESERIKKCFFDVRNDADALYALFDVRLAGVADIQLLELASRRGPKHVLCGLATCVDQEQTLSTPLLHKWQSTKTEVVKMFDSKRGGSYEVFNTRPLPQILIEYCDGDVRVLPMLSAIYEKRLSNGWSEKVRIKTEKRLADSRRPEYKPQGKHKIFGPRSWRFPPKKKPGSTAVAIAPATYNLRPVSSVQIPSQTAVWEL
ncbi:hypothetical protein LTR53_000017 [Teratosphaeriaceae sp. CCFEE 6253]|nr:hypothetical protein LTR53_000017 [Teratosphaeriaceae sp. CCFEE 6253]